MACQNHHVAYKAFPTGGRGEGVGRVWVNKAPAKYDKQSWSWAYQILPFIEENELWLNQDDAYVASTPTNAYFCPSRRGPTILKGGYWASWNTFRAQCDYAGNAGASSANGDGSGIYGDGHDGVIIQQSYGTTNLKNITDGSSKTLLIGEKRMNVTYCTTDQQPDDNDGFVGGFQDDVVRWVDHASPYGALVPDADWFGPPYTGANLHPGIFQFGSSHPGIAQFVMCDGSVQSISLLVDPLTFERLGVKNDGYTVDVIEK